MRDISRRIRSVGSIQQITRAMKMVAGAKLRRIEGRMLAMRPYTARIAALMGRFLPQAFGADHPLLEQRPIETVGVVFMAGDRGLCGSFNANLGRAFDDFVREQTQQPMPVAVVGKRAQKLCARRGVEPFVEYVDVYDTMTYTAAVAASEALAGGYVDGRYDALYFVHSRYVNAMTQQVQVQQVLPFDLSIVPQDALGDVPAVYLAEPSAEELAGRMVTEYMASQTYQAMMETSASEHAARMTAMDTATDNAEEVIGTLTLELNSARQGSITSEILDIVGGAEALRTS